MALSFYGGEGNVRVRMKVSIAGNDFSYHPTQEVELDDDLAKVWIEVGHCEKVGDVDGPQTDDTTDKRARKSGRSKSTS